MHRDDAAPAAAADGSAQQEQPPKSSDRGRSPPRKPNPKGKATGKEETPSAAVCFVVTPAKSVGRRVTFADTDTVKFVVRTKMTSWAKTYNDRSIGKTFEPKGPDDLKIMKKDERTAIWMAKRLFKQTHPREEFSKVALPSSKRSLSSSSSDSSGRRWIVDSGSCHDLVGQNNLMVKEAQSVTAINEPALLWTANGLITVDQEVSLPISRIGKKVYALVMNDSPNVLSLGRRIMEDGYSFEWKNGSYPRLVTPKGVAIDVEVQNFVPVLPAPDIREDDSEGEPAQDLSDSSEGQPAPPPIVKKEQFVKEETINPEQGVKKEKWEVLPKKAKGAKADTSDVPPPDHFLTHFPKDSRCDSCVKCKIQRKSCRKTSGINKE